MQAVRLARYHTAALAPGALLRRLSRLVGRRAAGRRQSGAGARDLHAERHVRGRRCACCARRRDIACVLVNPLQALHPNAGAPADSALVDSGRQRALRPRRLRRLAASGCARSARERGIVLIFDEVFVGFRLAPGGAQEYFGVQADMVTYGKTLGGGLPVGVLCGRARPDEALPRRPAGRHLLRPRHVQLASLRDGARCTSSCSGSRRRRSARSIDGLDELWNGRAAALNQRLRDGGPAGAGREPVVDLDGLLHAAVALQLDAAVLPARRGPGAELDRHRPADLQPQLHATPTSRRSPSASSRPPRRCSADGWWWADPATTNKSIKRRILREMIAHRFAPRCRPRRRVRDAAQPASASASSPCCACVSRIDQLAAQQVERRLVVELDVVERVGEDLGHPHQAGLHVLDEEQVHGAEQQPADAERPARSSPTWRMNSRGVGVRLEHAEQRRIEDRAASGDSAQIVSSTTLRCRL